MQREPRPERHDPASPFERAERERLVGPMLNAMGFHEIANDSRIQTIGGAGEPATKSAARAINLVRESLGGQIGLDDVLPRQHFLWQLRREKRRSDRSKSPLSIALFRYQGSAYDELRSTERMLTILHHNKRETDMLGELGHDLVAVLLPDTRGKGTQRFMQKIARHADALPFAQSVGTYPDQLFDALAAGTPRFAEFHPYFLDDGETQRFRDRVKRLLDLAGASVGLVLASPFMAVAALAIARTSPGPIIFKQVRLGRHGVPFVFYKFRTMHCNVDDRIHREHVAALIAGDSQSNTRGGTAKTWSKLEADPRITRVGRILRKTSIDELPQLFNVLKGDLSLVGPRPALPYEAEKYQAWHLRRIFARKPGISGLWQAYSRGDSTFDDMVRMDIQYIRNWSLGLDLKILLKTVKVVLRRTGAG